MIDSKGQELVVGDYVRIKPAVFFEYLIGKINKIGNEFIYVNYLSIDLSWEGGWWGHSLTKITEDEAIILILKGNS